MAKQSEKVSNPETTAMAAAAAELPRMEKEFVTSTGVTLKVTPPKTRIIYNLYMQNPEPRPPAVEVEQGGKKRWEENKDDPDYQEALSTHRNRIYESYVKIIVLTSTEILRLPAGMLSFDDDKDWQEELEAMGLLTKPLSNRKERFLEWFFYRVAPTHEDIFGIQAASESLVMTPEDAAKASQETFPSNS